MPGLLSDLRGASRISAVVPPDPPLNGIDRRGAFDHLLGEWRLVFSLLTYPSAVDGGLATQSSSNRMWAGALFIRSAMSR
jgi:hypothetical protein